MNYVRKIARNNMKQKQGNNEINLAWRSRQIKKYGVKDWCKLFNKSQNIKNKASRMTPKTAYYI